MTAKADFTNNVVKQNTRLSNLAYSMSSELLCPPHLGKLSSDWVELAGTGCPSATVVLPHLDTRQACFIGVDEDPDVIATCKTRDGARFHLGDIINLIRHGDDGLLDDAGVLNYDGFKCPGSILEAELVDLGKLARRQQERLGHFLLIVNVTLRQKHTKSRALSWIARTFPRLLGKGIHMPRDLGACEYVSKNRPMFNIPVGFGFQPTKNTSLPTVS